ncbi:hypothetical protein [Microbacterium sp.]|uniref:hypothetical protein n=1 Tax=Microbacterium sp. TaxID=51671 RepID=UPI003A8F5806
MSTFTTTPPADLGPIRPDWTIGQLIEWLSDDSRQHDPTLQHPLSLIEAALTGDQWSRPPSTVALIRSLTLAVPQHGSSVIADVLLPSRSLTLVA